MAKVLARIFFVVCFCCFTCLFARDSHAYTPPGNPPGKDSVIHPASLRYSRMNFIKRIFLGTNYRKIWATPVKMPVFDIKTVNGGFTIEELGGGQQTKSLRLKDQNGIEWVLRTVDKEVEKAIAPHLRKTFVKKLVQDMVSASHPYAPLTIPELAKAARVVAPSPTLYFVPDDPNLGQYQKLFANQVVTLEQREPTPDHSETLNTDDLLEELMQHNDHLVMQEQVLRARLLDMLVADWDRHSDQWRWGKVDSGKVEYYYVIPRDRDFAYFNSNGLLVKTMSMLTLPHMRGFTAESRGLKKLNKKTWFFDHNFLNEMDAADWQRITAEFQKDITDDVIHRAVSRMPPEVYALSGREIESKLRSRRDGLMKNVLKYYDVLARSVHVMGTDKKDFFRLSNQGNDLLVEVFDYAGKDKGRRMYKRVFKKSETGEIFLEGFGDNDHFEIENGVESKIRVHVMGGDGNDSIVNKGKVKERLESVEQKLDSASLADKK